MSIDLSRTSQWMFNVATQLNISYNLSLKGKYLAWEKKTRPSLKQTMAWNYIGCICCIGSIGCIDCNDYIGCICCIGCIRYIGCNGFIDCNDCIGCISCLRCIGCIGCDDCIGCMDCSGCISQSTILFRLQTC